MVVSFREKQNEVERAAIREGEGSEFSGGYA